MQGKRKVRERYLQINMNSQIFADFKTQIKEGFHYICVVCNRCLYKKSVISYKAENYGDANAVPFFLKLGFTPCKAEQPLQGMELQEKKHKKDYRIQKTCLERTYS